jgi:hypothetical protein
MPTILTPAQRRFFRVFLWVSLFVLANSAFLFTAHRREAMGLFYQAMLIAHVLGGAAVLAMATFFVVWHLRRVRNLLRFRAVFSGAGLTAAAYLLFASGLFIFSQANTREHRWIFVAHQALALLAPVLYAVHRLVSHFPPTARSAAKGGAAFLGLTAAMAAAHLATLPPAPLRTVPPVAEGDPFVPFVPKNYPDPSSPFAPSSTTTDSNNFFPARVVTREELGDFERIRADVEKYGFAASVPIGAETCRRCHPDVVAQWETSAHRFASFNNPFYRASVEKLRETRGKEVSQWCGGCHDPSIMLAGNMTKEIDPLTPESQAGLTCLACHVIERLHGLEGNGNYHVADEKPSPYLFDGASAGPLREVADLLIKVRPEVHKQQMKKPFFSTSEYCSTCHKVSLDVPVNRYRFVRGQNEYDNWHDSGVAHNAARTFYLPPVARNCQDCHMPPEEAPLGDVSAKNGKVRSHRFLAVNTALPWIRGDFETIERIERFLRDEKLRVDVFAMERVAGGGLVRALDLARPSLVAGEEVIFEVVVRNLGVGHTFPGGTNDSNEGWIDFAVLDDAGRELYRSGAIREDGRVDPAAHFYRVVMVRHDGTWANERDPHLFHFPAFVRVIGPGSADVARYAVRVPPELAGRRVSVRAALKWRKFNRDYTLFTFGQRGMKVPDLPHLKRPIPDLPVTVIAESEVALDVGTEPRAPHPVEDPAAWVRFNDHGIASFLQQAFDVAEESWKEVARLRPDLPDGYRNQARRFLQSATPERAEPLLRKAQEVAPDHPQNPYFWGVYFERVEEFEKAAGAFRASLATFPRDRDAWRRLGGALYKLQRYEESLDAYLEVLRIDPEDLEAHKRRLEIYRHLGKEREAAEAEKAFEKYRRDDQAEQVALEFLLRHPEINEDAQRRHVHR